MIFVDEGQKHRYIDSVERKSDRKKFRKKIQNFDSQIKNLRGAEPQNFRQIKHSSPKNGSQSGSNIYGRQSAELKYKAY